MQMNSQAATLVNGVITPAPVLPSIRKSERKPVTRSSSAAALAHECQRLTRTEIREDLVWLGLSLSALALLVLSFS